MAASPYNLQQRPGALIEASRNPKMKRAVMKAIGMPMKPIKRKGAIKMSGKFEGKSNALGQGGRAAQLKARGVPGGVIGNLARAAHAAPGQKNYHKKARKGSAGLVKAPNSRFVRKGTMGLVKSPKSTMRLRTKKALKGTSGRSFGDEKLQNLSMEHGDESKNDFRKGAKRRKGVASVKMPATPKMGASPKVTMPMMRAGGAMPKAPMKMKRKSAHSYKNLGKFAHKKKVAKKKYA